MGFQFLTTNQLNIERIDFSEFENLLMENNIDRLFFRD